MEMSAGPGMEMLATLGIADWPAVLPAGCDHPSPTASHWERVLLSTDAPRCHGQGGQATGGRGTMEGAATMREAPRLS